MFNENIDIASSCLEGLLKNKYKAILYVDKIKKGTVYRVVVKK
jgi:hypothetical protein